MNHGRHGRARKVGKLGDFNHGKHGRARKVGEIGNYSQKIPCNSVYSVVTSSSPIAMITAQAWKMGELNHGRHGRIWGEEGDLNHGRHGRARKVGDFNHGKHGRARKVGEIGNYSQKFPCNSVYSVVDVGQGSALPGRNVQKAHVPLAVKDYLTTAEESSVVHRWLWRSGQKGVTFYTGGAHD
jgi:hypothetical protein